MGALWSLPYSLLGIVFCGGCGVVPRPRDGLLVAERAGGLATVFLTWRGFSAITFGRVVICVGEADRSLLAHEGHHARQYEVLGPFFVPVYLWLQARGGYHAHPLEHEAAACAEAAVLNELDQPVGAPSAARNC